MSPYTSDKASRPYSSLEGLNFLPGDLDPLLSQTNPEDPNFEEDLALFTNSQFFDYEPDQTQTPASGYAPAQAMDFNPSDLRFSNFGFDYSNTDPALTQSPAERPLQRSADHTNVGATLSPSSISSISGQSASKRRRTDSVVDKLDGQEDVDNNAAISAEEDKRRRNTAASARFRVKKKQREQAMERTAKEMTDKVQHLEDRVAELQKENRLLKGLLTGKVQSSRDQKKAKEASSSNDSTSE